MLPNVVVPEYDLTLPLSKKKIRFRPFLVREEKLFLIAGESGDRKDMLNAIKQVIRNCVVFPKKFDVDTMNMTDVEFLFTHLRAKSMGEKVELQFKCNAKVGDDVCGHVSQYTIDLNAVKLNKEPDNPKIKITSTIGVVMRFPDMNFSDKLLSVGDNIDDTLGVLIDSIDYVYDEDKLFYPKDEPRDEWIKWLETLPKTTLEEMKTFLENIPRLSYDIPFKCKCGHEENIHLEGIEAFFA